MIPFPYADENPLPGKRLIVLSIIALNAAVFLKFHTQAAILAYGFVPSDLETLRWVSSLFLHGGLLHLLGNMWFLWIFGDNVEARMGAWFLPFYLVSGLAANAALWAVNPSSSVPAVGASGAICGVIAAYLILFPSAKVKCFWPFFRLRGAFISLSALTFGVIYILWQMVLFWLHGDERGIGYSAHLGGAVFGLAVGAFLRGLEPEETPLVSGAAGREPERGSAGEQRSTIEEAVRGEQEEAALREYVSTVRKDPYFTLSAPAQLWVADRIARHGHPHIAKDALERLVLRYPDDPLAAHAHMLIGFIEETYYRDFPAAAAAYRKALAGPKANFATKEDAGKRLKAVEVLVARTFVDAPKPGEECWVFQESGEAVSAGEPGVLLKDIPSDAAARRAEQYEKEGIPVVVVPKSGILELPEAELTTGFEIMEEGFSFTLAGGGSASVLWEDCLLIAGLGVKMTASVRKDPSLFGGGGMLERIVEASLMPRRRSHSPLWDMISMSGDSYQAVPAYRAPEYEDIERVVPLIEVVAWGPLRRYRWTPSSDVSVAAASGEKYFEKLQAAVMQAPNIPINRGAKDALKKELSPEVVFESLKRSDGYMFWQTQLAFLRRDGAFRRGDA
jgi:membrane associated rhomboid family serine protease